MYQPQLDRVVEYSTGDAFKEQIQNARKDFFSRTGGEVFEDDKSVETRLAAFLEWYLFDRPLDGKGQPPVVAFLEECRSTIPPEEISIHEDLGRSIHGLFELRRILKNERLKVRELCRNQDYQVFERRQLAGLEKGDLFEARLIPNQDELLFSPVFFYHPRPARKPILAEVKRRRKAGPIEPQSFIQLLSSMALKYERYRNVAVDAIYRFDGSGQPSSG